MFRTRSSDPSRWTSEPPRPRAGVAGGLVAAATFAGFVSYAFLSPATFRASATISVEPVDPADATKLGPLEAARRLHEAVLDGSVLERLATEQTGDSPAERLRVARQVQSAFQIDSVNGRVFTVSFRDVSRDRVESRCNQLAALAAERGPSVLGPERSIAQRKLDAERDAKLRNLLEFLTNHPELGSEPAQGSGSSEHEAARQTARELRAERNSIEARLARVSDNPYADPQAEQAERTRLERRLAQLSATILAANTPKPRDAPKIQAGVQAEWQRLLADIQRAREALEKPELLRGAMVGKVVVAASGSSWPVEPNRPFWLGIGALASLVLGVTVAWARSTAMDRRYSSRPPSSTPTPTPDVMGTFGTTGVMETSGKNPLSPPPLPRLDAPKNPVTFGQPLPLATPTAPPARMESPPAPAAAPLDRAATPRTPPTNAEGFPDTLRQRVAEVAADPFPNLAMPAADDQPTVVRVMPERPRAVVEVQTPLHAPGSRSASSSVPAGVMSAARTTQALGSPIPPILAPGSRRTPSVGHPPRSSAIPTSYSYVSTPAPAAPSAARGRPIPDGLLLPQPVIRGWRADLSLLPESRRGLCDEVYPLAVDGCCVVAVVAAHEAQDGKARLSAELAISLAESGHARVLLLEGNLQRPMVQRFLRVEMPAVSGFSQQLELRVGARPKQPWVIMECTASLHVLAEGARKNPELVLSQQFEECVRELRVAYDFIVIDGPPLSETAACRAVNDVVDGVVLLHGVTPGEEIARVHSMFPSRRLSLVPAAGG